MDYNMNEGYSARDGMGNGYGVLPQSARNSIEARAREYKAMGLTQDQATGRIIAEFREYPTATVIAIVATVYG